MPPPQRHAQGGDPSNRQIAKSPDRQISRIAGILLAAGRGRRMGTTKQLLPWPPRHTSTTVVAAAFDAIAPFCTDMIVVLGHEAEAVSQALGNRRFQAVPADPDAEMMVSIKLGLNAALSLRPPANAVLLQPGDHPRVQTATINALQTAWTAQPDRAVLPQFAGQGGHPALIPAALLPMILGFNKPGGLRQFWIENPSLCCRIAVDDPHVIADLDSPGDYRKPPSPPTPRIPRE